MEKIFFLFLTLISSLSQRIGNPYKSYTENLLFEMYEVEPPIFPDLTINIRDFGAIGDGKTLCTNSFINVINFLSEKGGGKLLIPSDIYFTGPNALKSNINLHLDFGPIIQLSSEKEFYPLIKMAYEGLNTIRYQFLYHQ